MSRRIVMLAADGMMATAYMGTQDLLRIANTIARRVNGGESTLFSIVQVSADGSPVRCANGCRLAVDGDLSLVQNDDVLITPSFMLASARELDSALEDWQTLLPFLRQRGPDMAMVASNCSGSLLLAEAGLLDGGVATTAWWLHDSLRKRYPQVQLEADALFVQSGNCLTGAASTAFFDVALALVERYGGKHFARLVAKYMMLDNQRRSQAPYTILSLFDSNDALVDRSEQWIRAHLARDFRIEELADAMAVSPRTLIRRFQKALGESPQSFTQKLRIEKSKALLETTQLRFSEIVQRCGYSDESAFRRLFKRHCELSPREYRLRFAARAS